MFHGGLFYSCLQYLQKFFLVTNPRSERIWLKLFLRLWNDVGVVVKEFLSTIPLRTFVQS